MDSCAEIERLRKIKRAIAKRWSVLFDTKDGKMHPKWYSAPHDETLTWEQVGRAARESLKKESDWLVGIHDISPIEDQNTEVSAPAAGCGGPLG